MKSVILMIIAVALLWPGISLADCNGLRPDRWKGKLQMGVYDPQTPEEEREAEMILDCNFAFTVDLRNGKSDDEVYANHDKCMKRISELFPCDP